MCSKMGRPKSENPLNVEVKIRLDKATNEKLLAYCEETGQTRTEVIRRGIKLILEEEKE